MSTNTKKDIFYLLFFAAFAYGALEQSIKIDDLLRSIGGLNPWTLIKGTDAVIRWSSIFIGVVLVSTYWLVPLCYITYEKIERFILELLGFDIQEVQSDNKE